VQVGRAPGAWDGSGAGRLGRPSSVPSKSGAERLLTRFCVSDRTHGFRMGCAGFPPISGRTVSQIR
jgi:hypothetical protein